MILRLRGGGIGRGKSVGKGSLWGAEKVEELDLSDIPMKLIPISWK